MREETRKQCKTCGFYYDCKVAVLFLIHMCVWQSIFIKITFQGLATHLVAVEGDRICWLRRLWPRWFGYLHKVESLVQ